MTETVYPFGASAEIICTDKMVLGGKGANLAKMAGTGFPVPPGFTFPTQQCIDYQKNSRDQQEAQVDTLMFLAGPYFHAIEEHFGYTPLYSVRSGAPVSMPGMMDTILNVGLDTNTLPEWQTRLGPRAALDCFRRLIQMFSNVVHGIPSELFEEILDEAKKNEGASADSELSKTALQGVVSKYLDLYEHLMDAPFPNAADQFPLAIAAVFDSWGNDRAVAYREANGIPHDMGTAVNIQAMVFGNMNDDSGSGVLFTRCPNTGEPGIVGEYLFNAQGEDVVAGVRTPLPIKALDDMNPDVYHLLTYYVEKLELVNLDMQDVEFTIQDGELFLLQTRSGKRSAEAAFRIARDMTNEGLIDKKEALSRVTSSQYMTLLRPRVDPDFTGKPTYIGIGASGSIVSGACVHTSEQAVKAHGKTILVTKETTPDDFTGMMASEGILTTTGGLTSHAAVVARSMDKTCIVGCASLDPNKIKKGELVTIDGRTGRVWVGVEVPVLVGVVPDSATELLSWGATPKKAMDLIEQNELATAVGEVCVKLDTDYPTITLARETVAPFLAILKERRWEMKGVIDLRGQMATMEDDEGHEFLAQMGASGYSPKKSKGDTFDGIVQALTYKKWGIEVRRRFALLLPETVTEGQLTVLAHAGWGIVREVDTFGGLMKSANKERVNYVQIGPGLKKRLKEDDLTVKQALNLLADAGRSVDVLPQVRTLQDRLIEVLGS